MSRSIYFLSALLLQSSHQVYASSNFYKDFFDENWHDHEILSDSDEKIPDFSLLDFSKEIDFDGVSETQSKKKIEIKRLNFFEDEEQKNGVNYKYILENWSNVQSLPKKVNKKNDFIKFSGEEPIELIEKHKIKFDEIIKKSNSLKRKQIELKDEFLEKTSEGETKPKKVNTKNDFIFDKMIEVNNPLKRKRIELKDVQFEETSESNTKEKKQKVCVVSNNVISDYINSNFNLDDKSLNRQDICKIISALESLPSNEQEETWGLFCKVVEELQLSGQSSNVHDIIDRIANLDSKNRTSTVKACLNLLNIPRFTARYVDNSPVLKVEKMVKLLPILDKISEENLSGILKVAQSVECNQQGSVDNVIEMIMKLSPEDSDSIIKLTLGFTKSVMDKINKNNKQKIHGYKVADIMRALKDVPVFQRKKVQELSLSLSVGDLADDCSIIESFGSLKYHFLENDVGDTVRDNAKKFINAFGKTAFTKRSPLLKCIKTLTSVSSENFNNVFEILKNNKKKLNLGEKNSKILDIAKIISSVPLNERDNLIKLILDNKSNGIFSQIPICEFMDYLKNVSAQNRQRFITFVLSNILTPPTDEINDIRIIMGELSVLINQLSQVPNPDDWAESLRGMRFRAHLQRDVNQFNNQFNNQTVHDKETEESIKSSVQKLNQRYGKQKSFDLNTITGLFLKKATDLVENKKLTATEFLVLKQFFDVGRARLGDNKNTAERYLNLAWFALLDKGIGKVMTERKQAFSDSDVDDRFKGWFMSGPFDAQLAYLLDNLDKSTYANKESLLEAIGKDSSIIIKGVSCVGGSYNRIIDGLTHMHPDVLVVRGKKSQENEAQMSRANFLTKQGVSLLSKAYEESPDVFDDLAKLKEKVLPNLEKLFKKECEENKYQMTNESYKNEINLYFSSQFESDVKKVTPLKDIQNYVDDQGKDGLTNFMMGWLGESEKMLIADMETKSKEEASLIIKYKLKGIKVKPSDSAVKELMDDAETMSKMASSRFVTEIYEKTAKNVLNKVSGNEFKAKQENLKKLMMEELLKQGKITKDDKIVEGEIQDFIRRNVDLLRKLN